jgi:HD domain
MGTTDLQKIKSFAQEKYSQNKGQHDIHHVERVSTNALKICGILGKDHEIDRNLLSAAGYLHDILITNIKGNLLLPLYYNFLERSINRKHLGGVIKKFNLPENESQILSEAIINHPYSIPYHILNKNNDIYSKILQDADSIDYISDARLASFNKKMWFLSSISKFYIYLIRKNIRYFLNFPEIAKRMEMFEGE